MMCVACHKATNADMITRYQSTKHAAAKPADDATPLDIYRRSVGFTSADNKYWEVGVGCQDCHGSGVAHLKAAAADKPTTIVRPSKLDTPKKKLSLCGRCHGDYTVNGKPFAEGFKPGDDLFAMEGFKLNDVTTPAPFQQLNDFMGSKHAANDVTCINCHTSHEPFVEGTKQLRKAVPDLCLECHTTQHKCTVVNPPADATCVSCHMPGGRHTFKTK